MLQQKEIPALSNKDIDRFWSKVSLTADYDLCWKWNGGIEKDGYGRIKIKGLMIKTHRLSYLFYFKVDPKELCVLHKCDNPICVNPKHLFLGTIADNNRDCVLKNRNAKGEKNGAYTKPYRRPSGDRHGSKTKPESIIMGEKHYNSRLSEAHVLEIRELYNSSKMNRADLANMYGVSWSHIDKIVKNHKWKHVADKIMISII